MGISVVKCHSLTVFLKLWAADYLWFERHFSLLHQLLKELDSLIFVMFLTLNRDSVFIKNSCSYMTVLFWHVLCFWLHEVNLCNKSGEWLLVWSDFWTVFSSTASSCWFMVIFECTVWSQQVFTFRYEAFFNWHVFHIFDSLRNTSVTVSCNSVGIWVLASDLGEIVFKWTSS